MPMKKPRGLTLASSQPRVFAFRFSWPTRLLLPALGVTPATSAVEVAGGQVLIRYGPWRARLDRRNIGAVTASGPFSAWKAIGPRLSLADRGLTFGTSARGGVCIRLRQPIGVLAPRKLVAHPAVTVTVTEPDELVRLLRPGLLRRLAALSAAVRQHQAGRGR